MTSKTPTPKAEKKMWKRALTISCWILGVLIVVAGCIIGGIAIYFSPERIKKLVIEKSGEYLDAEIGLGDLDYRVFSSYPWLEIKIDSLTVVSRSLTGLSPQQRKELPKDADFLASVEKIEAKINVHDLFKKNLTIKDIYVEKPKVNIVIANDSTANFNIMKSTGSMPEMPEINISEVHVESPVIFSFFSLPQDVEAGVDVEKFFLTHNEKEYRIGFEGVATGRYGEYKLPGSIPLKFNTGVQLNFPDLSLDLNSMSVVLAGLAIDLEGSARISPKGTDINSADIRLRIDDLFELMHWLPEVVTSKIKLPEGLTGKLPVNIEASLTKPYHIAKPLPEGLDLKIMPAVKGELDISDSDIAFAPKGMSPVMANDICLKLLFNFNPEDSQATTVEIPILKMAGEGVNLSGSAKINNLTGEIQNFEGDFNFESTLVETLSYLFPASAIKLGGHISGEIEFSGCSKELGKKGFQDLSLAAAMKSGALSVKGGMPGSMNLKNTQLRLSAEVPQYPLNDYAGTDIELNFKTDRLSYAGRGTKIGLAGVMMDFEAKDTVNGNPIPFGTLALNLKSMNFITQGASFETSNMKLQARGSLKTSTGSYTEPVEDTHGGADEVIASRIKHTPLTLEYDEGGILQTVMGMLNMNADFSMGPSKFKTSLYLYPIEWGGLNLNTDLDNLSYSLSNLQISDTRLIGMTGLITGLEPFMTSYSATPLKATADIDFRNVDINRLAWGYYGAQINKGADSVFYVAPVKPYTAADSICVAIPRNLDVYLRLKSQSAEYMGYKFSPLSTDIIVKEGTATLKNLTIGAPYCTAQVDWTYSTASLDNIYMDLNARVKDFQFESFYNTFPTLVNKMPEIKNLTGCLNAEVQCKFLMFPNMFMNPQSLTGNFDIKGSDFEFEREGKIAKITHFMLIEGEEPIHIHNFNITGSYHDDLLQVNPFRLNFDDYQLFFAGVNNAAGDMYYHAALEKSPFHLPFGVNIKGNFKHPEIRLGGTHIDDYPTELISTNLYSGIDVNIMTWLHHGWLLFVQEAAKYEGGVKE